MNKNQCGGGMRKKFILEVDDDECPFSNMKFCNHPLRNDKFCKNWGDINNRPDNCRLIEITSDSSDIRFFLNEIDYIARNSEDFPFQAWWEAEKILMKVANLTRN